MPPSAPLKERRRRRKKIICDGRLARSARGTFEGRREEERGARAIALREGSARAARGRGRRLHPSPVLTRGGSRRRGRRRRRVGRRLVTVRTLTRAGRGFGFGLLRGFRLVAAFTKWQGRDAEGEMRGGAAGVGAGRGNGQAGCGGQRHPDPPRSIRSRHAFPQCHEWDLKMEAVLCLTRPLRKSKQNQVVTQFELFFFRGGGGRQIGLP
jgi:hypothetical protein